MLETLLVNNLGLIRQAELALGDGLIVITGETGTGKTLLLGALDILTGGSGRKDLIGPHGDEATVQAQFSHDEEEVLVARTISQKRRAKAYVDGILSPVKQLATATEGLVEIVGQHDHLRLTSASYVLGLVDYTLGKKGIEALERYGRAFDHHRALLDQKDALGGDRRALERQLERARHEAEEIAAAELSPGEDVALHASIERLRNASAIIEGLDEAADYLGESGVEPQFDGALQAVQRVARLDPTLEPLLETMTDVANLLADLRADVVRAAVDMPSDAGVLDQAEARLALFGDLQRKYGDSLDEVIAYGADAAASSDRLFELLSKADKIGEELAASETLVRTTGAEVTKHRKAAAQQLTTAAVAHLKDLGFTDPVLECAMHASDPTSRGCDTIELLFASDSGLRPASVARVASGGELSRLVLAIRLAAQSGSAATAAFDEIDAGVGGAVALALGKKLATLATDRQVLCVTHLPQVAAFADTHIVVRRSGTETSVAAIDGTERVEELSRMLAGMPDSDRGREHAAELLASAGASKRA